MSPSKPFIALLLLIAFGSRVTYAQSAITGSVNSNLDRKEKSEFPQWALDLRRAEIIAFGTFPFTMFFAAFGVDTYRASSHGWDARYRPWPFKGAGAVGMSTNEQIITLSAAITGSVILAVADYLIVRHKRAKAERQRLNLPEGELIILRKPWPLEESAEDTPTEGTSAGDEMESRDIPENETTAGTP